MLAQPDSQVRAGEPARFLTERIVMPVGTSAVYPKLVGSNRVSRDDDTDSLVAHFEVETDRVNRRAVMRIRMSQSRQSGEED